MKPSIWLILMIVLVQQPVQAQSAAQITHHTFDNGLELLVWPDHDIPSVALYTFVRVGGRNEVPGITGLSHFFEHMMFNGTSNLAAGDFDRIMEAAGGSNNAYTSNDVTVYQDWFPAAAMEVVLGLEADRFAHLAFAPDVLDSEREVVYSERRSGVDNDNEGLLFEQVFANAFIAHPYGAPVLGWPSDIEGWTIKDLREFYGVYYAPNNRTMVMVGDIEPQQAIALVAANFAAQTAGKTPPVVRTREPEQLGERRLQVRREVVSPLVQLAFKTPAASDPHSVAVDLLLDILTDGASSRLYQRMIEKERSVISINAYRHAGFNPSITVFYMTLPEGADTHTAETHLYQELQAVIDHGVSARELQKVKNAAEVNYWSLVATINGKAHALGEYHVLHGDFKKLFSAPAEYASVTGEQIREVAARYFVPAQRTVVTMENVRHPVSPAAQDAP